MNPNEALTLLDEKLTEHGLAAQGWSGGLDSAERRFGICRPSQKKITLSRPLVSLNSYEEVLDTILHEIAHALAVMETGENCGHDERWKAICRRIGARPNRCYDSDEVNSPQAPWALVHRETGEVLAKCVTKPKGDLSLIFIRGRKEETMGKLELRANPDFNNKPLEYFDQVTALNLQQRILDTLQPLAEELGVELTSSKMSSHPGQVDLALSVALIPQDGLTPEQREFNQLAPSFGLQDSDYGRTLLYNHNKYQLIGFKLRNRKYPVIAKSSRGALYKLPLEALEYLVPLGVVD